MSQLKKNERPLDGEERDLQKALDSLDVKSIKKPSKARQSALKMAAANYSKKEAKMNIRIDPEELEAIKQRAAEEGLKYQPFVRSILHKYVTGRLVEKSARKKTDVNQAVDILEQGQGCID